MSKKSTSSIEWLKRQHNDPYVRKCQADGYRARSAYKLIEMNEKYNSKLLIGPGAVVMECGAAPGAWTQVVAEAVNAGGNYNNQKKLPSGNYVAKMHYLFTDCIEGGGGECGFQRSTNVSLTYFNLGMVVGCDLLNIEPVPGAILLSQCDFTLKESQQRILGVLGAQVRPRFDVVLSDMAPNASGQKQIDQDRILLLSYSALRFALLNSHKGSNFVTKVWAGPRVDNLVRDLKNFYSKVERVKPQASRKESGELYLVAQDFIGIEQKTTPDL
jgi:23S rRNA (uridine2552-2'-O)-methyltransferase